jgi:hypothetical protein
MGYFVRALCKATAPPKLSELQRWLKSRGNTAVIDDADLESESWASAALSYKSGKLPILIECNRDEGQDSLLREELEEFSEFLEDAEASEGKRRVEAHLKATKFIVACQLPTSDIDDDGYDANDAFLAYFAEHCGALIQADGEGFYQGEDLILELE